MSAPTIECKNRTCTNGLASCLREAGGCNGYGRKRHGGNAFTMRGKGKHMTDKNPLCVCCQGAGLVPCGCRPMGEIPPDDMADVLAIIDVKGGNFLAATAWHESAKAGA